MDPIQTPPCLKPLFMHSSLQFEWFEHEPTGIQVRGPNPSVEGKPVTLKALHY